MKFYKSLSFVFLLLTVCRLNSQQILDKKKSILKSEYNVPDILIAIIEHGKITKIIKHENGEDQVAERVE